MIRLFLIFAVGIVGFIFAFRPAQAAKLATFTPEKVPDVVLPESFSFELDTSFNNWFYNQPLTMVSDMNTSSDWLRATEISHNISNIILLRQTEIMNGIPTDLLVRLAWQESRYNVNAWNAGSNASGIMQIVPRWHPGVDPWNPKEAIPYAGSFLSRLYRKFGTWTLALKAYNWGEGNVAEWLAARKTEPLETQKYSAEILADLASTGRTYA